MVSRKSHKLKIAGFESQPCNHLRSPLTVNELAETKHAGQMCWDYAKRRAGGESPQAEEFYLKNLCMLSTELLDNILAAYHHGQMGRADKTIRAIEKELFDRALKETLCETEVT